MEKKKSLIFLSLMVLVTLLTITAGTAFAYYSFTVGGTHDKLTTTATTPKLTDLNLKGDTVIDSSQKIYPGWKGIQKFTVSVPESTDPTATGGTYTLTLNATVDTNFKTDILYEVYKTTTATDSITRQEGTLTPNPNSLYREDTISFTGTWQSNSTHQPVKQGTLTSGSNEVDTGTFDGNFQNTIYYIVFKYQKSETDQSAAMGKNFTATVNISLSVE